MITPPPDWKRSVAHQVLVLRPPHGEGRVRCHLQLPVGTFAQVVGHLLAEDAGFEVLAHGGPRRMVTLEGEYGCAIDLTGTHAGTPARRWIAAILLDGWIVAIDGLSLEEGADAAIAECVRSVFHSASFGLGSRRRRFVYARPPGWQALATGLITTFYPPGYPRHRAQLVVYPAEPSSEAPGDVFNALLADEERRGFERSRIVTAEPFAWHLSTGFHFAYGGQWTSDPAPVSRDAVVLSEGRHYYVLRLESAAAESLEEDREVLRRVARSVEPLPHPGEGAPTVDVVRLAELSGPWAE